MADTMGSEVFWWTGKGPFQKAHKRSHVVQRKYCVHMAPAVRAIANAGFSLQMLWIGIFQYCFIRVFFTFVSLISEATGRYCENSLNPVFAHIWVELFEGISVTLAMYCIFHFYFQIKAEIAEHRPFMKLLCIKLVIFFSFWQTVRTGEGLASAATRLTSHA